MRRKRTPPPAKVFRPPRAADFPPRAADSPPPRGADSGDLRARDLLTWDEVRRTHPIRNGVYQKGGRLVSLLTDFGLINTCYPDRRGDGDPDTVEYVGAGRRGDQHLTPANRALLAAVESGHAVPLFNKLAVGRWQFTGRWRVASARHEFDPRENRMLWRFTLKRVHARDGSTVTADRKEP